MRDYVVRSTVTHAESAARRAADVIIIIMLCAAAVFVFFRLVWVPVATADPCVTGLENGELLIVDRVSKYFAAYETGDIVRAEVSGALNAYRVAAPGGSSVLVRGGKLYVNNALMDDSAYAGGWREDIELACSVPENCLLLLPDDRSGVTSLNDFVVPAGAVFGKVRLRLYPFGRIAIFN